MQSALEDTAALNGQLTVGRYGDGALKLTRDRDESISRHNDGALESSSDCGSPTRSYGEGALNYAGDVDMPSVHDVHR
jgi:hypothetical protein